MIIDNDFSGVFQFTNWTDEDFTALWNNKEYTFVKGAMSPLIISDESLENIQEIRKRFAYRLAEREFYKSKEFSKMNKAGGTTPATFNPKLLEPMIEKCLNPLPVVKAKVKEGKKTSEKEFKGSKAIGIKDNPNFVFKDEAENAEVLGQMPDSMPQL